VKGLITAEPAMGRGKPLQGILLWRPGIDQVFQARLAPLVLAGPGPRPALEPFKLDAEDGAPLLFRALPRLLPFGLTLQKLRVGAGVLVDAPRVDLHDRGADGVQKIAVVGDHEEAEGGILEQGFQPFDGIEVEVIGRLVEKQEVCALRQGAGQGGFAYQAAGQVGHGPG
jgi:hypothetical protein